MELPASAKLPGSHMLQLSAPEIELNLPALQFSHVDEPVALW